jgi:hypothetical protein
MLNLDQKAKDIAAETIKLPDMDCVSNDWVPEMFRVLEERAGHELPNLVIDRQPPAGYA